MPKMSTAFASPMTNDIDDTEKKRESKPPFLAPDTNSSDGTSVRSSQSSGNRTKKSASVTSFGGNTSREELAGLRNGSAKAQVQPSNSSITSRRGSGSPGTSIHSVRSHEDLAQAPKVTKSSILASLSGASAALAAKTGTPASSMRNRSRKGRRQSSNSTSTDLSSLPRSMSSPMDDGSSVLSGSSNAPSSRRGKLNGLFDSSHEPSSTSSRSSSQPAEPSLETAPSYPSARARASTIEQIETQENSVEQANEDEAEEIRVAREETERMLTGGDRSDAPELRKRSNSSTSISKRGRRGFSRDDESIVDTIPEENTEEEDNLSSKLRTWRLRRNQLDEWVRTSTWDDLIVIRYLHSFGKVSIVPTPKVLCTTDSGLVFPQDVKQVQAVKVLDPAEVENAAFPEADDWKRVDSNGKVTFNATGYYLASTTAFASAIFSSTPTRFERETKVAPSELGVSEDSSVTARNEASHERLYVSALPIYRGLFGGIRDLSRWKNKGGTLVVMIVSPIAEYFPSFISLSTLSRFSQIYFVLWRFSLLVFAAIVLPLLVLLKMRDHPPAPQLLRASMLDKSHRMLIAKRSAALAGAPRLQQDLLEETPGNSRARRSAASAWADEIAAAHERAKNLALGKSPPATLRLFTWLVMCLIAVALLDSKILSRWSGLAFGVYFFFLAPLWAKFPRLCPIPDLSANLLGTPDDDECAMETIRRRASAEKPVLDHPIMLIALRSVGEDDLGNAEDGGEYFV